MILMHTQACESLLDALIRLPCYWLGFRFNKVRGYLIEDGEVANDFCVVEM
jgi:hypothetical protein